MKRTLTVALLTLCGCTTPNISRLVRELAKDPATVDLDVQTPYGRITLHRHYPTNWVPTLKAEGP